MALSAFQKAFKDARASGETEFEFGGKKYNTKYKEEASSSPKKTNENYSNEGRGSKAPAPTTTTPSTTPSTSTAATNKSNPYEYKMPITKFFEGIRERGNKDLEERGLKHGGKVKKMASGGSASKRADGIASRGKTRGKIC
jgi:hypothetical protein